MNKDILAIMISMTAIVFTAIQYYLEIKRKKKEDTLNAFETLQSKVFDEKIEKSSIEQLVNRSIDDRKKDDNWKGITSKLARVEHFCVGVNSGIYDAKLLNRLAGGFFILWYENLKPIIELKCKDTPESKHYDELELLVNTLKKLRE